LKDYEHDCLGGRERLFLEDFSREVEEFLQPIVEEKSRANLENARTFKARNAD